MINVILPCFWILIYCHIFEYVRVILGGKRNWESPASGNKIGHFRVPKNLTLKARLSANPLIWKWVLIMMQIKLIFTTKVSHLASFWKWDFFELGNGLLVGALCLIRALLTFWNFLNSPDIKLKYWNVLQNCFQDCQNIRVWFHGYYNK